MTLCQGCSSAQGTAAAAGNLWTQLFKERGAGRTGPEQLTDPTLCVSPPEQETGPDPPGILQSRQRQNLDFGPRTIYLLHPSLPLSYPTPAQAPLLPNVDMDYSELVSFHFWRTQSWETVGGGGRSRKGLQEA